MKIMVFSMDFKPRGGGIAEYDHRVVTGLKRLGEDVVAAGPEMEGAAEFDATCGYKVVRMKIGDPARRMPWQRAMRHLSRRRTLKRAIGEHGVEHILFGEWGDMCWEASQWAKKEGVGYSVVVHGLETTEGFSASAPPRHGREGLKGAMRVFVNSRFTWESIRVLGIPEAGFRLAYPGVDAEEFSPKELSEEERSQLGLKGRKMVLTVCRLVERKGVDRSLKAMAEVVKTIPELTYIVSGDGPDRGRLEKMTDELGLREHVRFVGYLGGQRLVTLYRACDCFLMPARELPGGDVETFGIVFLEANGCGKPVIAGRSGGMVEAVAEGKTGLVVNPEDSGEIAAAVKRLLTDKELAGRMGQAGRKRVVEELAWDVRAKQIRDDLREALAENNGESTEIRQGKR